jgi:hypothetical protein
LSKEKDKFLDDMVNKYMLEKVLKSDKDESPPVDKLLNISKFAAEKELTVNMGRIELSIKLVELLYNARDSTANSRTEIYAQLESVILNKIASLLNDIKIKDD